MTKSKFLLPSLLLMGSMAMNAQTISVLPEGAPATHNDQFFVGETATITFDGNKMTVTPATNKGAAKDYDITETSTVFELSEDEVVPVKLYKIDGLSYAMTSYVAPKKLDVTKVAVCDNNLKAYYATKTDATGIYLEDVNVVDKEQAVMFSGYEGWYCIPVDAEAKVSDKTNLFKGSLTTPYTVKATDNIFAFSISGRCFRKVATGVEVPVSKAYIAVPEINAQLLSLNFIDGQEDATGVEAVAIAGNDDAVLYNAAGQQVAAGTKGLVISKNKKIVNK